MITVIVSYTVNKDFFEQNKANIRRFLDDFKKLDASLFQYVVCHHDDNCTFVHSSIYQNAEIQNAILNVPSFKEFQRLRDDSGLNGTHKVEVLTFVGKSGSL